MKTVDFLETIEACDPKVGTLVEGISNQFQEIRCTCA